jgi:hypothetical protein
MPLSRLELFALSMASPKVVATRMGKAADDPGAHRIGHDKTMTGQSLAIEADILMR